MTEISHPSSPPPLTKADLPEIIQRYLNGESIGSIAADARKTRQAIYDWMHCQGEAEWQQQKRQALVTRLANADHDLATAATQLDLARAREECKFTRWDLERRWHSQFGPKQEVSMDNKITVIVQRDRPLPIVVSEGTPDTQEAESMGIINGNS